MSQVTKAYATEPFWVRTPDIQSSRLTPYLKKIVMPLVLEALPTTTPGPSVKTEKSVNVRTLLFYGYKVCVI